MKNLNRVRVVDCCTKRGALRAYEYGQCQNNNQDGKHDEKDTWGQTQNIRVTRRPVRNQVRLPGYWTGEFAPHYDETHTMIKPCTASSRTDRKGSHQVIDRILGLNLTPRVAHKCGRMRISFDLALHLRPDGISTDIQH